MKNKLTTITLEKLTKNKESIKLVTGIMIGLVLVTAIAGFVDYNSSKSFSFTQVLPFFFIPILVLNFVRIKKINNEINSRN